MLHYKATRDGITDARSGCDWRISYITGFIVLLKMESQAEGADTVGEQVISQDLRGMGERKLHCRLKNCSRASPVGNT